MLAITKQAPEAGVELAAVEPQQLASGWVRLSMTYAGICGSDVATYRWAAHRHRLEPLLPFVLGHEGVGRVVEVADDVRSVRVGDRVAPEPLIPCYRCTACLRDGTNRCPDAQRLGSDLPGTMAQELVVPETACYLVPDSMSDREAALLEVLAVAMHGARRPTEIAGAHCAVIGPGSVGLCLQLVLQAMGAAGVTLFGRERNRGRLAIGSGLGATRTVAVGSDGSPPADVLGGYDAVFEAAGDPAALVLGAEVTAPGGVLVALGGYHTAVTIDYSKLLRMRGIDLLASRARIPSDWDVMLSMLSGGVLDVSGIPTEVFPLSAGPAAFEAAASGRVVKALLECGDVAEGGSRG